MADAVPVEGSVSEVEINPVSLELTHLNLEGRECKRLMKGAGNANLHASLIRGVPRQIRALGLVHLGVGVS